MISYHKKGIILVKITPREKEWRRLLKQEQAFLEKGTRKKDSKLNQILEDKVPEKLQGTLDAAFAKAFETIFEKGTGVLEKTYKKEELERQFKINSYAVELKEDKKSLRKFSRKTDTANTKNLLLSSVEGVGLGALGIGLPDIPVFVGVLLKSVYEVALNFGYGYDTPEEKYFILKMIETALSYGDDLAQGDQQLNEFIEQSARPQDYDQGRQIKITSATMSKELLYLKFLQGIPIVGAVGGAYNTIYLQKVLKYAKLKYHRRFLTDNEVDPFPDDVC